MAKRRNKRLDEQSDSAASQSEDENHDDNPYHKKNHEEIDSSDVNTSKQLLLEKKAIFKMNHENKCAYAKSTSSKSWVESLNEIQTLYDEIGHETSLDQYVIRSTKTRWLTCKEDMEHWE